MTNDGKDSGVRPAGSVSDEGNVCVAERPPPSGASIELDETTDGDFLLDWLKSPEYGSPLDRGNNGMPVAQAKRGVEAVDDRSRIVATRLKQPLKQIQSWALEHWRPLSIASFLVLLVFLASAPSVVPDWLRHYYGLTSP